MNSNKSNVRHYKFYERLEKGDRKIVEKRRNSILGSSGKVIRARFRGGTPDFTSAGGVRRSRQINPGKSYDLDFIHAGALVYAPK